LNKKGKPDKFAIGYLALINLTNEVYMKEMIYVLIFLGIYILVQTVILPKMGIST